MSRVIEELTAVAPTFSLSSSVVQAPTFNIHIISQHILQGHILLQSFSIRSNRAQPINFPRNICNDFVFKCFLSNRHSHLKNNLRSMRLNDTCKMYEIYYHEYQSHAKRRKIKKSITCIDLKVQHVHQPHDLPN